MLVLSLFGVNSSSTQHTAATTTDDDATAVQKQEHKQYTMRSVLVRLWHSAQSRLVKVRPTLHNYN
jgi:hypothetical protein